MMMIVMVVMVVGGNILMKYFGEKDYKEYILDARQYRSLEKERERNNYLPGDYYHEVHYIPDIS